MFNFLRRYKIIEIGLGLIAIVALTIGIYDVGNSRVEAASQMTQIAQIESDEVELDGEEMDADDVDEEAGYQEEIDFESECDDHHHEDKYLDDESEFDEMDEDDFWVMEAMATELDMTLDELETALVSGKTITALAEEKELNAAQFAQEMVAKEQVFIQSLQDKGEISADEAAWWMAEASLVTQFTIEQGYLDMELVAARELGLSMEELWAGLEKGVSFSEMAAYQQVAVDDVERALLAEEERLIVYLESADFISSEEAAEWRDYHKQEVADFMSGKWLEEDEE